jgi:membrane protease YdiL (CAAX protease family)
MRQPNYREPYAYPPYGIVRRVWRLLYPFLIFTGATVFIVYVIMYGYGLIADIAANGTVSYERVVYAAYDFVNEYPMLISTIQYLIMVPVAYAFWRKTRVHRPAVIPGDTKKAVIGAALFCPGLALLASYISMLTTLNDVGDYTDMMAMVIDSDLILQFIAVVILAPIAEELCYRGIILNRALYWMPKWAAVLIPALLFAIGHMRIAQGAFALLLGISFGWLYVRFRSLKICVIAHIAVNLVSTITNQIAFTVPNGGDVALIIYAVFIVIAIASFLLILRKAKPAQLAVGMISTEE